jgi:hypothetical protein
VVLDNVADIDQLRGLLPTTVPTCVKPDALAVAWQVYRTAAAWRPLPHRTVLLTDELDACLDRFAARTGEPVSPADHALIA